MLAAALLLVAAGSAGGALTPAQLEKKVADQAATIAALTRRLDALQKSQDALQRTVGGLSSNVLSLLPLAPLKAQLLAVRRWGGRGAPGSAGVQVQAGRCKCTLIGWAFELLGEVERC